MKIDNVNDAGVMSHTNALLRRAAMVAVLGAMFGFGIGHAANAVDASSSPVAETAMKKTEAVMSDSWITTKVKSEILANSITKEFHVGVKTKHGIVTLKGKLASQDAIDQVKAIAEKVEGVKHVNASAMTVAVK